MAQGTDVGSLGTGHGHRHTRQFHRIYLKIIDFHRTRCPLYLFSGSRQLVELLSVDLERRIHRRYLHIRTNKALRRPADCRFCQLFRRFLRKNRSCHILRIGFGSQQKNCLIRLPLIRQKVAQLRALPQTYREYALRCRIERTRMTDLFLSQNAPELRHHIVGRKPRFFINVYHTVKHKIS